MLSYISSYLASRPRTPSAHQVLPDSNSGNRAALHGDQQLWEVQWEELEIERPIGRGSFGFVYLSHWNQIQVVSPCMA